jgi:hypothetical protein
MTPSTMTKRAAAGIATVTFSFLGLFGALFLTHASDGSGGGDTLGSDGPLLGRSGGGPEIWRVGEPVRYENLSIFPLISKTGADTSRFETLDEGLAAGDVLITEQGNEILRRSRDGRPIPTSYSGDSVNQLVLPNRGKRPLLLLAGELVSGGNQDRIVGKDRIVPVGEEPLPLDVFCVEHGRWTGDSKKFGAANLMVHPSVREKAAVDSDQQQVWNAVQLGSTSPAARTAAGIVAGVAGGRASAAPAPAPAISAQTVEVEVGTDAPTQAYQKIYQSPRVSRSVDEFANEMTRRFTRATAGMKGEAVIGVVVAYGGEVAWSDAFASADLFKQYWPKLVRSYVVEALARPATKEEASLDDAHAFLERANGHVREESEPGAYIWRERTEGQYSEIELDSVKPEEMLHWMKVLRTN